MPLARQISTLVTGIQKRGEKEGKITKKETLPSLYDNPKTNYIQTQNMDWGVRSMSVEGPTGPVQKKKRVLGH
ncbi:unnamed protein product [Ixodes persulcatus]